MSIIQSIILGLIQGLTEFLPISSSGHLVLAEKMLGVHSNISFGIALHIATLIAVFVVFHKDLWEMIKKPFGKVPLLIIAGTIPTVLIAIIFKDVIEKAFSSGNTIGVEFLITGLIILYIGSRSGEKKLEDMKLSDATLIGVAQGVAIMPAISRSGLTLAAGLSRNIDRESAIRYSFLLSIPAILGSAVFDIKDLMDGVNSSIGSTPLILGMLAAGLSGYFAMRTMLKVFSKKSLKPFAVYTLILGSLIILDQTVLHILF